MAHKIWTRNYFMSEIKAQQIQALSTNSHSLARYGLAILGV